MLDELPNGWVKTTLGEIAEPSRERALPVEVPDMRYVGLGQIESQTMRIIGHKNAREVRSSSVRFSEGCVLYGRLRPYLNKVWVAEFDGICSTEFIVLPKRTWLNSHFLGMRLNAEDFVTFANGQVSGERPRVNFKKLSHFPILLPPLTEQERIVAKLDAAFTRLDRAETATRRAQERLKRYRAAVLRDAVTGELTHEWREAQRKTRKANHETSEALLQRLLAARRASWEGNELQRLRTIGKEPKGDKWKSRYPEPTPLKIINLHILPDDWVWTTLEHLTLADRPICYGILMPKQHIPNGVPYVKVRDMNGEVINVNELQRTSNKIAAAYTRSTLRNGDLLLSIRGTYGRIAVVPPELDGGNITQDTARLAMSPLMIAEHVLWSIRSDMVQTYFKRVAHGVAVKGVNIADVKTTPIPLPPIAEQTQIVREVEHLLAAADRLAATLVQQFGRIRTIRQSLLGEAFSGQLVPQNSEDESSSLLLERIQTENAQIKAERKLARQGLRPIKKKRSDIMHDELPSPESLKVAWERIGKKADARLLFDEAGFSTDCVEEFYEALRATPEVRDAFQEVAQRDRQPQKPTNPSKERFSEPKGRFRLVKLWLEDFKNLKDYTVRFDPAHGLNVILGWNGTGKSNLFEALVIIFRDLYEWWEKNRWPDKPMNGFHVCYEIDEHTLEVTWRPGQMKRPELKKGPIATTAKNKIKLISIKRDQLLLPRSVFGYYSGPTNRLAEHFISMKQAHYNRLLKAKTDDEETIADLLEQRRFFCAETHHAKYALLAFSYKEDTKISEFLIERLRILGFESALFVIRKPRWAKPKSKAADFWGAKGIVRGVMERLHRFAIAPMVLEQTVSYGYRSTTEDHYYFLLPNLDSLHSFAAEYQDARTFFLALESTDFSELIHDVKIQVRIKASNMDQVPITFHQLSEGEQQLLMVLGLMRFTKSHQSLVLLDEPDTHLNPHWSVEYLKDLTSVMSENVLESPEQQSSQILMATHDPLVVASLVKEQIHLLKRDVETDACKWEPASINPRGLGFTGILTSEMFGFRSDLDPETLADLDNRVRLVAKEATLSAQEKKELEKIDQRLTDAGFSKAFSDPYFAAFVRAWGRKHSELMAGEQFLTSEKREEIDRIASQVLKEAIEEVEREVPG